MQVNGAIFNYINPKQHYVAIYDNMKPYCLYEIIQKTLKGIFRHWSQCLTKTPTCISA